jgi:hypothetical protein
MCVRNFVIINKRLANRECCCRCVSIVWRDRTRPATPLTPAPTPAEMKNTEYTHIYLIVYSGQYKLYTLWAWVNWNRDAGTVAGTGLTRLNASSKRNCSDGGEAWASEPSKSPTARTHTHSLKRLSLCVINPAQSGILSRGHFDVTRPHERVRVYKRGGGGGTGEKVRQWRRIVLGQQNTRTI